MCVENNMGVSPIEPTLYGIRWGYTIARMESCLTGRPRLDFEERDSGNNHLNEPRTGMSVDEFL